MSKKGESPLKSLRSHLLVPGGGISNRTTIWKLYGGSYAMHPLGGRETGVAGHRFRGGTQRLAGHSTNLGQNGARESAIEKPDHAGGLSGLSIFALARFRWFAGCRPTKVRAVMETRG